MNKVTSKVFVIDDDEEILSAYSLLLRSTGHQVECFTGIDLFLERENYIGAGCILLDVFLGAKPVLKCRQKLNLSLNFCQLFLLQDMEIFR